MWQICDLGTVHRLTSEMPRNSKTRLYRTFHVGLRRDDQPMKDRHQEKVPVPIDDEQESTP